MSDEESESLETRLRRLRPAGAPEPFRDRLKQAVAPAATHGSRVEAPSPSGVSVADRMSPVAAWRAWLRWLTPLAGVGVVLAVLLLTRKQPAPVPADVALAVEPQPIGEVELDQQLVAAFEGVAEVPGGPPLRFRCYRWREELTFRDASGTIEVEQRAPRLELVPVGFDVY